MMLVSQQNSHLQCPPPPPGLLSFREGRGDHSRSQVFWFFKSVNVELLGSRGSLSESDGSKGSSYRKVHTDACAQFCMWFDVVRGLLCSGTQNLTCLIYGTLLGDCGCSVALCWALSLGRTRKGATSVLDPKEFLGKSKLPQRVSDSLYFSSFVHSFSTYFLVPICQVQY